MYLINTLKDSFMATTSLLVPTLAALTSTKYTPQELTNMRAIEAWFTNADKPLRLQFLLALWEAYRDGDATISFDFGTYEEASAARAFLVNTDYGYTVTGPFLDPDPAAIPPAPPTTSILVNLA
jgi:hypothetical protein